MGNSKEKEFALSNLTIKRKTMSEPQAEDGLATKIDGNKIAKECRADIKAWTEQLIAEKGVTPGLAVVLVGARTDSATYVRMKKKAAKEVLFHSVDVNLETTVTQDELLSEIDKLNDDPKVHAILVQLPLPDHIDEATILKRIKLEKDADGFLAENIGRVWLKGGDKPMAILVPRLELLSFCSVLTLRFLESTALLLEGVILLVCQSLVFFRTLTELSLVFTQEQKIWKSILDVQTSW